MSQALIDRKTVNWTVTRRVLEPHVNARAVEHVVTWKELPLLPELIAFHTNGTDVTSALWRNFVSFKIVQSGFVQRLRRNSVVKLK